LKIVIKNGRVIDPASKVDEVLDVLIEDDTIADISRNITARDDYGVIDAAGCLVLPGLIDMHVHFREPGREDVETIYGGSKVAARSGFTSVCTMPNTDPVIDNQALVRFIKLEAEKGPVNVFPVATITKGMKGEEISEMGELINAGAVGFSDDGLPVMSSILMRRALEYSRMFNVPIIAHSEDLELTDEGIMNEGKNSTLLGLKGLPRESEEVMIARDVILTRLTGGRLHVAHVSSGGSLEIIRRAKSDGIRVTCETAPHYFSLTDDAVAEYLSMAKMKPPLRTEEDRKAIIEGLKRGIIDVIASDHAPHSPNEKMQELEYAPFGIVGLETAVPLIITILVRENGFSYAEAFEKVTINPARILKIDRGELKIGKVADVTIINPDKKVVITEDFMLSKCKNSPFIGKELYGSVEFTLCNGNVVHSRI
jgi:dihydroorotase